MASPAATTAPSDAAGPGNMADVRRNNLALVLARVAQAPAGTHLTRAQVAAATGLTKASVSSIVLDLLGADLLREVGLSRQGERGRPGVGLELNPARGVMGLEINVDYIAAGVTDLSGALLVHEVQDRNNRDSAPGPVLAALARLAGKVRHAAARQGVTILGGGLAVPGLVDASRSLVISAPNLGWNNVALDPDLVMPDVQLDVLLFNEANAAALAEVRHRPGADFLFVSGEVGIGGGLVIGSELFTGPGGHAGEVGHMVVDPDGAPCSCGGRGCLETVAGQDAILTAAGIGAVPGSTRSQALAALLHALATGEPGALLAVERAGRSLGVALASAARVVNISSVVLGGHFAVLETWLRAPLAESVAIHAPGSILPERITVSAVGEAGALMGAAGSAVRSLLEAPHRLLR